MRRFIYLVAFLVTAWVFGTFVSRALATPKVLICKYVGTPGVNETLQTGQNPISVSQNAIANFQGVGSSFNDAQGRSFVVAFDTGQDEPTCPSPTPNNPPVVPPVVTTPPVTTPTSNPTEVPPTSTPVDVPRGEGK